MKLSELIKEFFKMHPEYEDASGLEFMTWINPRSIQLFQISIQGTFFKLYKIRHGRLKEEL